MRVRLNTNEDDRKRGLNRAENIRAIPEGEPDWARICKLRPMSEGRNSNSKHRQSWDLAPAVGRPRQRSALLFGHLFKNFKAYLTYCRRVGLPLPSQRGQAAA